MNRRNIAQFNQFSIASFESLESFMDTPAPNGVITINYNNLPLDILNINRESLDTLIVFHAALSRKVQTLPVFSGQQISSALNMNLIAISDPSLVFDDELNLAWFLGNKNHNLITELPRIIEHILASHVNARPIYFGASGGGFAALLYSRERADAVTIVANPRIDLTAPPMQDLGPYLRHCFGAVGRTSALRIMRENIVLRLQELYAEGNSNKVLYVQNFRDGHYLRRNMMPFLESMSENPLLSLCLPDLGMGHRPIPTDLLSNIISGVTQNRDSFNNKLGELGFRTAPSLTEVRKWSAELLSS